MRRRSTAFMAFVLAAAALATGCGPAFLAARPGQRCGPRDAAARPGAEPAEIAYDLGAPVADLSGVDLGLPRFFLGLGYGELRPEDSTLARSIVYDLNFAYDLSSVLTFEVLFGLWNVGDRPVGIPDADSSLEMRPMLAMLQLYGDIQRARARVYVAVGAGYSRNTYDLGSDHAYHVENVDGIPDYTVQADDDYLLQCAVGVDKYSTADADLNLGIELRYVWGQLERLERSGSTYVRTMDQDVDLRLYLLRASVTWHF